MNKRIITLGLLVGVLSLNSCVKDNESDVVQAQRQAQTEKLKAEAGKLMADKALSEALAAKASAEAKVEEELAAYNKASHELALALQKAKDEETIIAKQLSVEKKKIALEKAKQLAKHDLEVLKFTLQQKTDSLSQALATYVGDNDTKVLKNLDQKLKNYSKLLRDLGDEKVKLVNEKQNLIGLENNKVDLEKSKEKEIADAKAEIESQKQKIEYLKQYATYADDIPALNVKISKLNEEIALLNNLGDAKWNEYSKVASESGQIRSHIASSYYRKKEYAFYAAAETLRSRGYLVGSLYEAEGKTKEENGIVASYTEYDVNYLPSLDNARLDLRLDKLDQDIKAKQTDVDNAVQAVTAAQQDVDTKKAAYEADKTNAANKAAYEAALANLDNKKADLKTKSDALVALQNDKKELVDARAAFINADNRKEVKDAFMKHNEIELKAADLYLESQEIYGKMAPISNELNALNAVKGGAQQVSDAIADAEKVIVAKEREIADISNISSLDELIIKKKAEIANIEAKIAVLEKQVAVAKKAYEDTLASI